jgi:hypothetical protein
MAIRLLPVIITLFAIIGLFVDSNVYADGEPLPTTTLNHIGAKVDVQWQLWNLSPEDVDNGEFNKFVPYQFGTPIERTWTKAPHAWWSIKKGDLSKCGPITKIELTNGEGEVIEAFTASDKEKGLHYSDLPGYGTLNQHPETLSQDGKQPGESQYDAYELWNVFDEGAVNCSTLVSMEILSSDYVEINWGQADFSEALEGTNHIINIYFNGAEDIPAIPEEVQAVIKAIDAIGEVTKDNYAEKETLVTGARTKYDALESQDLKDQVTNYDTLTAAEASIDLFKARTSAKGELDTLLAGKNEADYDVDDWTVLTEAISDGKDAIDAATTTDGVNEAKSDAEKAVSAIKTKAQKAEKILEAAKTEAKGELDTLLAGKNETDYDTDDWTALTKAISDGKDAIGAATTTDGVNEAKSAAENAVAAIKTKEQKAKEKAEKIKKQKAAAKKYKVAGLKVTSKNRKFTLTWKKTKGASGYQVQYRLKGAKKYKTLKTLTKTKVISKKLKLNKKYQFRVRTYTKIEGVKIYGKWTKAKTVKCNGSLLMKSQV